MKLIYFRSYTKGVLLTLFSVSLMACKKDIPDPEPDKLPKRTVIVYMAANNNLADEAYVNIDEMEEGFKDIDGRLIVYAHLQNKPYPALYEIQHNTAFGINSKQVKEYPLHSSVDPRAMKEVLKEAIDLYPAESYGVILWSHATSWVPPGTPKLKAFGQDWGNDEREMDIRDLESALPSGLEFIVFDACSMASIEVAYELKDKARYILASPAETVADGLPYKAVVPHLFTNVDGLKQVAKTYFDHYNAMTGLYQSATVSLIDTEQLAALAQKTSAFLNAYPFLYSDFRRDEIQRFDLADNMPTPASFDFVDFFEKNFDAETVAPLKEQIQKTILYKAHTDTFNGKPIYAFSGLSCYIPHVDNAFINPYYASLKWYQDGGFYHLFE